jgi:hypothetical protein
MESELLVLFKQIIHIKDTLLEKINTHFRHLALNKEFFFEIYNQPNSNIRIIENILDNVCRSHDSINKFIGENNKEVHEKLDGFQKNLKFIEKIKKLFLPYKRFLNLAEDEKPVYAVKTTLINGMDHQNKFIKKNKGLLFITNFDLSFVHEYGMMKKKQELIFKAPINDLIDIADKGKLFKKLCIQFDYGKYEFSLPSNIIIKVIDYIILARSFQENDLYNYEIANNLQDVDIDLNDLMRYIEEGINSFFSLKIKYNKKLNLKQKSELEQNSTNVLNTQYYNHMKNKPQYPDYYNRNLPPVWPQKQIYPSSQSHTPEKIYYRSMRSSEPYDFEQSRFYAQNNSQPHRYQNYHPHHEFNLNQHQYQRPYPYDNRQDFDERNILMKRLEKMHKFDQEVPPYINQVKNNSVNQFGAQTSTDTSYNNYFYQDFQKNHLSEFFDPNDPSLQNPNIMRKDLNEKSKEEQKRMIELKREQYSLKKTLKELETKFESGVISEVDYFRTFKKLQKDIYSIEKKIESLQERFDDELFRRRNYSKKKYTF